MEIVDRVEIVHATTIADGDNITQIRINYEGNMQKEPQVEMLGESENYAIWRSYETEPDAVIYHIEFGNVTFHLFEEEWAEFIELVRSLK